MESASFFENLEEIYYTLYYGLGIAELGINGIILLYTVITGLIATVFGMLVSLLLFILQSIPLYKVSKKMKRPSANLVWLTWLPIIGSYLSVYILSDIPGKQPLYLTNKISIKDRFWSFWIHVGIKVFGPTLITTFILIIGIIPIFGQIIGSVSALLYLVPTAAVAWIEYAYLRDVLNIFNPDQSANRKSAIIIAVLDALVTFGFARAFYLYTIMNKSPLPINYTGGNNGYYANYGSGYNSGYYTNANTGYNAGYNTDYNRRW